MIFIDPFEDQRRTGFRVDVVDDPHRRTRDIVERSQEL
jgi:hypothetical protein